MVATTFLDPEREIDLDLPEAESSTMPEETPDQIVINVFEDGRISLAGRTIDREGLAREPAPRGAREPEHAGHDPR